MLRVLKDVIPGNAGPLLHPVDDRDTSLDMPAIANRGINSDTVLNDHSRDAPVIPHQAVVVRHMDQQYIGVIDGVTSIDGVWLRGVMFEVNFRKQALFIVQNLELVLEVILRGLVDDEIKLQVPNAFRRHLSHIRGEIEGAASPSVALRAARFDREVPVGLDARQCVQVAAMNMPDQDL